MLILKPLLVVASTRVFAPVTTKLFMGNKASFQANVPGDSGAPATSIFDFSVPHHVDGSAPISLSTLRGVTNQNYADLKVMYEKYGPAGLEILAFPCNDFLYQESGTNDEIQEFAKRKGASFPVFGKVVCEYGEQTHPLFKYLKYTVDKKAISWNFNKFLCDANGIPVKRFGSKDTFAMEPEIQALLARSPSTAAAAAAAAAVSAPGDSKE